MNVLHVLYGGGVGGIEKLCLSICECSKTHYFYFIEEFGECFFEMRKKFSNRVFSYYGKKVKHHNVSSEILKLCDKYNFEKIVIHHGGWCLWNVAIDLSKKKKRVFVYVHSYIEDILHHQISGVKATFLSLLFKQVICHVNGIFAISKAVKDNLIELFPSAKNKVILNYNGVDLSHFKENSNQKNDRVRLVYVGRIIEEKGIQTTFEYIKQYGDKDITLDIIGDGPYVSVLKKQLDLLGINEQITFCGQKTNVAQCLPLYDAFVHFPKWEEGFGIAVVEAMASGLPCFVNSRGAMREIVDDNINGFIVDNYSEFSRKMDFFKDSSCRRQLRENALKKSSQFSILFTIKGIEEA